MDERTENEYPKLPWQVIIPGFNIFYMIKYWKDLDAYEEHRRREYEAFRSLSLAYKSRREPE